MFVAGGFAVALVLGISGFLDQGYSFTNSTYRSVELFLLSGGENTHGVWQLEIARFLAPLVLSFATIRGLFAIALANAGVVGGNLFARGHVVLISEKEPARQGIVDLAELVRSEAFLKGRKLTMIAPDPRRIPRAFKLAGASRASEIVVAPGDDELALVVVDEVTSALSGWRARSRRTLPPVRAELHNWSLWSQMQRIDFAGGRGVTWFNQNQAAALLISRDELGLDPAAPTLCSTDSDVEQLLTGKPESLIFASSDQATPLLRQAIVCHKTAEDTLAEALNACARLEPGGTLACVCSGELGNVISRVGSRDRVEVKIIDSAEWMTPWFEMTAEEMVARGVHDHYRKLGLEEGWINEDSPSNVPWEELGEELRASNRAFARGISTKLESLGLCLRPAEPGAKLFEFSAEQLEELAQTEHQRWWDERIDAGWTAGPKDTANKVSPTLVPWEELSEVERDKDRLLVAAIPAWIHNFGYGIFSE